MGRGRSRAPLPLSRPLCTYHPRSPPSPAPRASVPIEHVLQLACDLKSHLLASCSSMRAAATGEPSSKKAKGQEKRKKGKGGKRRKQSEPGGGEGEAEGGDEEQVVEEEEETYESWSDVLAGLTQVRAAAGAGEMQGWR